MFEILYYITRSPYGEPIFSYKSAPASPTPSHHRESTTISIKNNKSTKTKSSPSNKSPYLGPDQLQARYPTLTHQSSVKKNKSTTPTSPLMAKLFNNRLTDYNNYRELKENHTNIDHAYSRQSSSDAYVHYISPNTSPCQSPGIRIFRKQTSPSLINLKSPETSPLTSRSLSPNSPHSLYSSTNISPDQIHNNSNSSQSPSPIYSSISSIFSFNTSENSLVPLTSWSPLSTSLMNLPRRVQRPISPLVLNHPPEGRNRINYKRLTHKSKRKAYGKKVFVLYGICDNL